MLSNIKKKQKILLITFSIFDGYVDTIKGISKILNSRGVECWYCCDYRFEKDVDDSAKAKYLNVPPKNGLCKQTFNIKQLNKLKKWIKKSGFDIIYFESVHVWNLFFLFFLKKVFFYSSIHDVLPHDGSNKHSINVIYKYILKKSRVVFVRSKYSLSEMKIQYPNRINKISMFPLAVNYGEFNPKKEITKKILFFGRIKKYKGIDTLFEIASKCPFYRFEIYGKCDNDLKEDLKKLSCLSNVSINEGFIDKNIISTIISECDFVIFPYRSATQSGVVLDAYSFSRPVIAFDVGSMSEQIINSKTGFLIQKGNVPAFCDCLEKLNNLNLQQLNTLCLHAYEYGRSSFSFENCANSLYQTIQNDLCFKERQKKK